MVWYGFVSRLPTTIFWTSLGYVAGFGGVTLVLTITGTHPAGAWLTLYWLGALAFVPAALLAFAGSLSRSGRWSSNPAEETREPDDVRSA